MLNFPNTPTSGQVFFDSGSTWIWDGVKWAATLEPVPVTTMAPVSGAVVAMPNRQPLYINNASVLANLTIRLPPSPVPGEVEIGFRNSVTALVIQTYEGAAVAGSPTSAYGPGAALSMCYIDSTVGWVYWK